MWLAARNDIVKRLSGALGEHSDASLVKLVNSELYQRVAKEAASQEKSGPGAGARRPRVPPATRQQGGFDHLATGRGQLS